MKQFCLGVVIAAGLTLPAFGQSVDPLIGSWKLNVEKSTTVGFPMYKALTQTFSGEGQTFINTNDGIDGQGQPLKTVFRHIYDGMPHPTTDSPVYDSSAYTRIGNTINAVSFRQGKTVEVRQGVIVPGKTFTVTGEGIDPNNQPYHYVLVLERQ